MKLFLLVVTTLSLYIYKLVPDCRAWAHFLICFLGACIEKTEIMLSREHLPPTPPLHLLGGMGGGGYMGNWKYQAGCGEFGVTSTLCNTCQFPALRNGLCTRWQFCRCQCQIAMFPAVHRMAVLVVTVSACCVPCSAPDGSSGGDSVSLLCSLQCTRWQFWWWQCQPAVFSAVHLEGSAPDGSSVSAIVSIRCSVQYIWRCCWTSCHFWFSKRLVSDTFTQNWTAAMQPGILCSEKQKRHKAEGPRPKPLVVQ